MGGPHSVQTHEVVWLLHSKQLATYGIGFTNIAIVIRWIRKDCFLIVA